MERTRGRNGGSRWHDASLALAKAVGFAVGAGLGGGLFGVIGYRVFVLQASFDYQPVGSLAFLVLFLLGIFAFVAPFALGKFFGSRLRTKAAGDLVYVVSVVVGFGFLVGMSVAGAYALQVYDVTNLFGVFVVFDIVTGATVGGILGYIGVERILDRLADSANGL